MIFDLIVTLLGGIIYIISGVALVILWVVPVVLMSAIACLYYIVEALVRVIFKGKGR